MVEYQQAKNLGKASEGYDDSKLHTFPNCIKSHENDHACVLLWAFVSQSWATACWFDVDR